jgi:hypothetical protein
MNDVRPKNAADMMAKSQFVLYVILPTCVDFRQGVPRCKSHVGSGVETAIQRKAKNLSQGVRRDFDVLLTD